GPVLDRLSAIESEPMGYIHGLWVLQRLGRLPENALDEALQHRNGVVRQHAFRVLAESEHLTEPKRRLVLAALSDNDPFIQRTAAEVLSRFLDLTHIEPLLALYKNCPDVDSHLKYTALLAVRNNLRGEGVAKRINQMNWD